MEDEIELEEIDSEEIENEEKDNGSNTMVCSLCKIYLPSSQTVDHLRKHHHIQRFSALESLLNLGIIMKAKNINYNSTEPCLMTSMRNITSKDSKDVASDVKDGCGMVDKGPSYNVKASNSYLEGEIDRKVVPILYKNRNVSNSAQKGQHSCAPQVSALQQSHRLGWLLS